MLDQAQSSGISRSLPTAGPSQSSPQHPDADPGSHGSGLSETTRTDDPLYSIRVAESPGSLCADCGQQETGSGPVGYLDDRAVCDLCFLLGSHELGMVLAVVSVTRSYANVRGNTDEWQAALEELGAFARVYERFAAKSGPARRIRRLPDFSGSNDATH